MLLSSSCSKYFTSNIEKTQGVKGKLRKGRGLFRKGGLSALALMASKCSTLWIGVL